MQQERMEEIKTREERLLAWQKEQFGEEGALVKRQQDLIRPLQDKIYAAVQKYARDKSYDLIFDRAAGNQLLFVSPKLDKSNEILAAMGVVRKSPTAKAQPKPTNNSKTPPKASQPPAPATGSQRMP
jgi:outer membrane protein